MKLVATEGGRILDHVPLEEMRPPGGIFVPDLIRAIVERYQFVAPPPNLADAIKSGAKFEHGKFVHGDMTAVIKELAIYADGVIGGSFNTDLADLILDDFFAWATTTFKLRERPGPVHRTYTSGVFVEFEKEIEPAIGKMATVCEMLSGALKSSYGWDYKYNATRLAFAVDPMTTTQYRITNFILERKLQSPFSENRYYSVAPLRTSDHLKLLEMIERELLS
jgi:hypothetical protein